MLQVTLRVAWGGGISAPVTPKRLFNNGSAIPVVSEVM